MDAADRAQHLEQRERDDVLARRSLASAAALAGAGDHRACIDCEEEIDPARLGANPRAMRCIDCQTRHERIART